MLVGVVLAGGLSSRMGADKALLQWQGQSLLDRAQTLLNESGVSKVVVSGELGIADRYTAQGPVGGIVSVVMNLQMQPHDQLIVLPVDMPLLTTEHINNLCQYAEQHHTSAYYEGYVLPSLLRIEHAVSNKVIRLFENGETMSVKRLLALCNAVPIPCFEQNKFINLNTPAEWQRFHTHHV
ncbi:molybdenum cofactor guanylyltransferase [Aestuariibacter salexigens]|uniref:molybdenum cofactor guanylyltransferase n=1 Tax=Aestuariibacter salexigens TaxID=226010 RepID=UPI00041065BA|nr:molybdenum cofactor guanylyltransferase [Aestuariibacter salexigens]